ncbi:MAG: GNAT family N-acetyltransferase [Burkholderiales bacterium]
MTELLGNIIWHALTGTQAQYAAGTDEARRYAPGFSPIVGFVNPAQARFDALLPFCSPGEQLYCAGWSGAVPSGWQVEHETTMLQMVWQAGMPEAGEAPEAVRLGPQHARQAYELATLTRPGPFGARTTELGEYFGCFDGDRLVAMAGERMHAGTLREISGVCTHPEFQGRGLARRLMHTLIAREMQRGETPFLHVMQGNTGARELYARMGFRQHDAVVLRVVSQR